MDQRTSDDLHALADELRALARREPLEQAEQARELIDRAKKVLSRVRQNAIYDATRQEPWDAVADKLGVSTPTINKAVTGYLRTRANDESTSTPEEPVDESSRQPHRDPRPGFSRRRRAGGPGRRTQPRCDRPTGCEEGVRRVNDTFKFGDSDEPHEVGNENCTACWKDADVCECGGIMHNEFGDEDSNDDYWLYTRCDKCGKSA